MAEQRRTKVRRRKDEQSTEWVVRVLGDQIDLSDPANVRAFIKVSEYVEGCHSPSAATLRAIWDFAIWESVR